MNAEREPLDYRDLESELENALNMGAIASERVERALDGSANAKKCHYYLSDGEVRLIHFAVYHAEDLLKAVKAKWNEIHDSNVAAKEGGAK